MRRRHGVVMVVQNESELIERTIRSFYEHVDHIVVSTDPNRGMSGLPVEPDDTLDIIRALDGDRKIEILKGDFCVSGSAMANETRQRQVTEDHLLARGRFDWVWQIDADEEFVDFASSADRVERLPLWIRGVFWHMAVVYNTLPDGRLLLVTNGKDAAPEWDYLPMVHRPGARLVHARQVGPPRGLGRSERIRRLYTHGVPALGRTAVLHFSFARSEPAVARKLATWSHSGDVDQKRYLELWKSSRERWADLRDVHPIVPSTWPALRPFSRAELRTMLTGHMEHPPEGCAA